ncbi:MAG: 4-(cytidine 5'-diphospho)-2-C-methyl-D-erythritol kinase, partial [Rhodobacteraceae bacterium]|nr:4-(cytidine 5'-diphospho)-2-C-methyl-D-erythritol kinase [Paracoccaceae bacterium]
MARAFAPAKINLTLHVTGRRADGFHLLDSLVVFADIGDQVSVSRLDRLRLQVTGPMAAGVPDGADNLVLRAARLTGVAGADITLEKHLPMAAGIGGGSSDAAAVLRALAQSHGAAIPDNVLTLGADVPVCLAAKSARMSGIGETVEAVDQMPTLHAVLVNPGIAISTPKVFRALDRHDGAAMADIPRFGDAFDCVQWLRRQRNDLQPASIKLAPAIGDVLAALGQSGAIFARMSGSGATCFGLYETEVAARSAAKTLSADNAGWWVQSTNLAA